MNSNKLIKVSFGGGCHWCTEAVFQAVKGVFQVQQGYLSTLEESEVFYEGIILKYDPDLIQMKSLIAIHLKTHQSASNHSRRDGYLSAVYVFNEQQKLQVIKILKMFQKKYSSKFITQAIMFGKFEESREQLYLVGSLQIIGAIGLCAGYFLDLNLLTIISAIGLALLMLLGFGVRLRIRDTFIQSAPSVIYSAINIYIAIAVIYEN